ncbi:MAG: hypothetical protein HYX33_02715 [Actinobacteria bacterium]|nr:hypothetical protein [Actinomycetota bacterium]
MSGHISRRGIATLTTVAILAMGATGVSAKSDQATTPTAKKYAKWAKAHKLSGRSALRSADVDRDQLTNWGEFRSGTNPRDSDSDNDGVNDGREDRDSDGLDNATEQRLGTDPSSGDDLSGVERGHIEVRGTIRSYAPPSATAPGSLVVQVGNNASTLAIPAGTVVSGGALIVPGALLKVEIEREHGATVLKVKSERAESGGSQDGGQDTSSDSSGSDDRGGRR